MPYYDFRCKECEILEEDVVVDRKDLPTFVRACPACGKPMKRLFPGSVHTKIGSTVDSHDQGKVTAEKNAALKKKWSGYAHEEQRLRKTLTAYGEKKARESA